MSKGHGFAAEANRRHIARPVQKPKIVLISHEEMLVGSLARHRSLKEHIDICALVRENGFMNPFKSGNIDRALEGARMLIISPIRHSVHEDTAVFAIEKYAVTEAIKSRIPIGLIITEMECARPPYLNDTAGRVRSIALFDDYKSALAKHYRLANFINLNEIDVSERKLHSLFVKEAVRKRFPGNVRTFSKILADIALSPT